MGLYRRFYIAFFLIVVTALAVFAQEEDDWYRGKPVQDIVFVGLRHIKLSELEGIIEPYKGRVFDDAFVWELQGKLYALDYFETITPGAVRADAAGEQVILRFTVTERPIVSRVTFEGNKGVRRSELLDVTSIKTNDVVNQSKLRMDEQAIINKYLEKGYPDVQVRSETRAGPDSTLLLVFYITEGEKISISEFRFEGNTVFSDRTLRGQLSLRTKNLIFDGAFQEAKLLADREALTKYYHDRGYIDAEVIDVVRDMSRDEKGNNNLALTFRISEGRMYVFGGITFEGNRIFSTEQLNKLVNSKVGETVNANRVEADLQRVSEIYYANGYIFNTIGRQENRDPDTGVVTYTIPIVERGRAHIENIIVRGNVKTKTNVILREIPLEPGDVFSRTKVMDGLRNLANLQYFYNVVPDTPPGSADSLMDLVLNVEEQPTTDIQFGLTFSGSADPNSFPISGMLRWNDRNLMGSGNQLGIEVNSSIIDSTSVSVDYTHAWIFGLPLSGGFDFTFQYTKRMAAQNKNGPNFNGDETYAFPDGFSSYEEYEKNNKRPADEYLMEYEQWYLSLGFSTGYRWPTYLGNLSLSGGVRVGVVQNTYDNQLYRPFDPVLRERNNQWTPKNSLWTGLSLDNRDVYYDPSNGYYASQRVGAYGLLNNELEHYLRTDTRAEYFFTIFNIPVTEKWSFKSIFGVHSGLSLILKQPGREGNGGLPLIDNANKLAVDGMFVGRGWSSAYSNKGLLLWENWAEVRFPLVPNIIAWDFFFDAAGVEGTQGLYLGDFSIENMRFSLGAGLRFTLPQFPFRFSLAKRFRVVDGAFQWEQGQIPFGDGPGSGIDPVISFAISY
ncbi:MAG: outer membrane protein assembly factor BamA [Treponema sp.]|jgi:outer membrane protein insertion porin family|nr:outer membrane protein assembly factor BamA [Treponema sp.]